MDTRTAGSEWGTGGMATKLTAARMATAAGCRMAICLASEPERMSALLQGWPAAGTVFHPHPNALTFAFHSLLMFRAELLASPLSEHDVLPVHGVVSSSVWASCSSAQQTRAAAEVRQVGTRTAPAAVARCEPDSSCDMPSCNCRGKRRWILSVPVKGALWMDAGALLAVSDKRKSLFAAGIVR